MRRRYLDWLRGIGVLLMIEWHTLDSWTLVADRSLTAYRWLMVVSGFGTVVFLFLAGVSVSLAAGARMRRGRTTASVTRQACKRALELFALAFLFRLQAILISGGAWSTMLKVDILNVMGLSMLAAALLWSVGRHTAVRAVLLVTAAAAIALITPMVRVTPVLDGLPDPIEWYFRPAAGRTAFTLFPWAGFLLAGAAVGLWLDAAQTPQQERRANIRLAALGLAVALGGYAASFLPPIYPRVDFWTSSPTFFLIRLGVLMAAVPLAYMWRSATHGRSWIEEFGLASFFVYWIHVEMVYGVPSMWIHRRLPLVGALVACVMLGAFLFWLVKLKERVFTTKGTKQIEVHEDPKRVFRVLRWPSRPSW